MPLDAREFLTPPEAAAVVRMDVHRILTLIRSGELRASNVATRLSGKPRYRIARADLQDWLDRRAAASVRTPTARRRRQREERPEGWVSYFGMDAPR